MAAHNYFVPQVVVEAEVAVEMKVRLTIKVVEAEAAVEMAVEMAETEAVLMQTEISHLHLMAPRGLAAQEEIPAQARLADKFQQYSVMNVVLAEMRELEAAQP